MLLFTSIKMIMIINSVGQNIRIFSNIRINIRFEYFFLVSNIRTRLFRISEYSKYSMRIFEIRHYSSNIRIFDGEFSNIRKKSFVEEN